MPTADKYTIHWKLILMQIVCMRNEGSVVSMKYIYKTKQEKKNHSSAAFLQDTHLHPFIKGGAGLCSQRNRYFL